METVSAYEAKTHLPELLRRVRLGEKIMITRHGVPVAVLSPFDTANKKDVKVVIEELKKFSHHHSLAGLSIKEVINEGRR